MNLWEVPKHIKGQESLSGSACWSPAVFCSSPILSEAGYKVGCTSGPLHLLLL